MAFRIAMEELGLANDNAVIEGATPGDVWRRVQAHLKEHHRINLPDLNDVGDAGILPLVPRIDNSAPLTGAQGPAVGVPLVGNRLEGDDDMEARTIVTRLIEKLRVGEQGSSSSDIVPPGGTHSPMP